MIKKLKRILFLCLIVLCSPFSAKSHITQFITAMDNWKSISNLTLAGDRFFFYADSGKGNRLWVSDGTEIGTHKVEMAVNYDESKFGAVYLETVIGDKLVYSVIYLNPENKAVEDIFMTDGTTENTKLLSRMEPAPQLTSSFFVYKSSLYREISTSEYGLELFKLDTLGTGFKILKDIRQGPQSSNARLAFILRDTLFIMADSGGVHYLYKTDGTEEGTVRVCSIPYVDADPDIGDFYPYKDMYCFDGEDDIHGVELWVTDGTKLGTKMFAEINPYDHSMPLSMYQFGDYIYCMANGGHDGWQLWAANGKPGGTHMVKKLGGVDGSYPDQLIAVNNQLFFVAYNKNSQRCLYKTDGTENGTALLLEPLGSAMVANLTDFNNKLYCTNSALYECNGTIDGTKQILDSNNVKIIPTSNLIVTKSTLYFARNDNELWKIEIPSDVQESSKQNVFSIFPNPANDFLIVNFQDNINQHSLEILDFAGRIVYYNDNLSNKEVISLSRLSNGVYFAKMFLGDQLVIKKIVITK